jgi:hypothetical protein
MVSGSSGKLMQTLRSRLLRAVSWQIVSGSSGKLMQPLRSRLLRAVSWQIVWQLS